MPGALQGSLRQKRTEESAHLGGGLIREPLGARPPLENRAIHLDQLTTVLLRHVVIKAPQAASKLGGEIGFLQMAVTHVRWVWQFPGVEEAMDFVAISEQEF